MPRPAAPSKSAMIKQKIFIASFFFFSFYAFSQDSELSIELNYPYATRDNFLGNQLNGLVDIGAKYFFSEIAPVSLGASMNAALFHFQSNGNTMFTDYKITSFLIQPRFVSQVQLKNWTDFRPFIGLGYSFLITRVTGTLRAADVSAASNTRSGLNANIGFSLKMTRRLFAQIQYDFIHLAPLEGIEANSFNTNVNLVKVGLGFRL